MISVHLGFCDDHLYFTTQATEKYTNSNVLYLNPPARGDPFFIFHLPLYVVTRDKKSKDLDQNTSLYGSLQRSWYGKPAEKAGSWWWEGLGKPTLVLAMVEVDLVHWPLAGIHTICRQRGGGPHHPADRLARRLLQPLKKCIQAV